ncbi:MAG: HAD-IIB family hydrolase [Gammaproteobacteria bacterium]
MSKHILLCTDLDRTLLPNGSQPESPEARQYFDRFVSRAEVTLAYVTGRHRDLVDEAIQEYDLPMPDWVIGDVGTTIYRIQAGEWRHWTEWEDDIARDWRGSKSIELRPLFSDLSVLRLQEDSKQNCYKLSYYLPPDTDFDTLRRLMSRRLTERNLSASIIYSIDEAAAVGLLDVLPARATKLHAVEFLMQRLNFDRTTTVFAGDSGNDLPVLTSAIQSVLVANAHRDVAEQAQALASQQGTISTLYLAKGGFMGMNGNYSAGILEGVGHFLPFTRQWLEPADER